MTIQLKQLKLAQKQSPWGISGSARSYPGFGSLFNNFVSYTMISALVFLPLVIWALLVDDGLAFLQFDVNKVGWTGFAGGSFISMVLGFIAYASIVYGAIEQQAGNKIGVIKMLSGGVNQLVPVVLASILITLLTLLGYILLIIPGVIISLALAATVPAIVAEKLGPLEALKRSASLTDGFKWTIFWAMMVIGLIELVLNFALEFLQQAPVTSGTDSSLYIPIAVFLIQTAITTALGGTVAAAIYSQLRTAKEGVSADDIAQVFA